MRVRVKICGITRPDDAACVAAAGADAIGLVFHASSPRAVDIRQACEVVGATGAFVGAVALFVDPDPGRVREVVAGVRPELLQFHGVEDDAFCAQFGVPYLKALRIGRHAPPPAFFETHPGARGLLLDTLEAGRAGGTGQRFDWGLVPPAIAGRIVLAGGLDAGNVEEAITRLRPWAVDASSRLESAPGRKDPRKVEAFMRAVARANAALAGPDGE